MVQQLLDEVEWSSCIVFSATKKGTNELERLLNKKGIKAGSIHGDKSQDERTKSLRDFKNGAVPVIVATDVLARGIDIDNVSLIINYDVPKAVEDYIHRVGRTGRYDKEGIAITLVSKADQKYFDPIKNKVGKSLVVLEMDEELPVSNEPKEIKPKAEKRDPKTLTPINVEKEDVSISTNAEGRVVIKLKNKPEPVAVVEGKKEVVEKPKKASKPVVTKKAPKKKEIEVKKKKIEIKKKEPTVKPDRIEKATKRNKNIRKPAKGFWGIIKSFIPRFGKD